MRVEPDADIAFVFGPFKLIPCRQVLLRDNRPVKLGGRALDILHLLIIRAGEEVSKDALIEFAWPNVFIDEGNLKVHIRSLRQALDDTAQHGTFIATVVRRGYKFVGRVRTERIEIGDHAEVDKAVACSLPACTDLIGRGHDVDSVSQAIDTENLITLVGPGGVGKTSLAIAVANAKGDAFCDGVHFVDLPAITDPALVPHLMATSLGIRGDPADLVSTMAKYLRDRRILIILDNCEHVLHAAAALAAQLVQAKIRSCLLATSRQPLGVSGENVKRIEPLAYPQRAEIRPKNALAYPAVELFALRALEKADYKLSDRELPVIARLCEALDGLPLAIEIAAAKLDQFTPEELLFSVGRSLRALRNDNEAIHSRHRSLWATLHWSYRLLSKEEATIFRLLSVFVGSFEWTDVIGMARLVLYDPYVISVALGQLVARSLLTAEIDGEQIRYQFLETVRCYAADCLLQDPLAQEARHQHARLVLSVFEKSNLEWPCIDNRVWRARYEARTGDLRKALDWCFEDGNAASLGVDLATAAMRFWNEQSSMFEQLSQVDRALDHCTSTCMTDALRRRAALATSRAWCMAFGGQLHAATDEAWNTALRFTELSNDVGQRLSVMCGMSLFLVATGRLEQSVCLLDEVIRVATLAGERASLFDGERLRAMAEARRGNLFDAQTKLEHLAVELDRGMPQSMHVRYQLQAYVTIHGMLAFSNWLMGRPRRALAMAEEMVIKTGENGHLMGQSRILTLFALPLTLWSGHISDLQRYSSILEGNLNRGHIVMWEHVHRFYASAGRHAGGDHGAVDDMRTAIDDLVRDRFLERTPMYLGVLAEALIERGRSADADEAVERALTLQHQTAENWCLPELLRVKARLMNVRGDRKGANTILDEARKRAISFRAKSLELRIVNDMAQMASDDGNHREVVTMLGPLYANFKTDELATEDLKRSDRILAAATRDTAMTVVR